jgi:hypothetical protein
MDSTDQLGEIPGSFGDRDVFDGHIRQYVKSDSQITQQIFVDPISTNPPLAMRTLDEIPLKLAVAKYGFKFAASSKLCLVRMH